MRHLSLRPKTLVRHVIVSILLALGILLIPNLSVFDEELLPEITEHLATLRHPDIEGNAAPLMYGLAAASDRDMESAGEAMLARLHAKYRENKPANLSEQEYLEIMGGQDLDKHWSSLYPAVRCNPREQSNCFDILLSELEKNPVNDQRLLVQLARYKSIIQMPHFIEATHELDANSPLPEYGQSLYLGRIVAADSYLNAGINGLIKTSTAEMKFWRTALKESQTLLGKMVAINTLKRNLDNLSYAISKEPELTDDTLAALGDLLQPLHHDELHVDLFAGEYRIMANDPDVFTSMGENLKTPKWLLRLLGQHKATVNRVYQQTYAPAQKLSQMSSPDFYIAAQAPLKPLSFSRLNPYNLGGKIATDHVWEMADYIGRIHDLNGIFLLVNLQRELKVSAPHDLTTAIKASRFRNPYTQKPFAYEPATNTLSFACYDARDSCRIQL